MYMGSNVADFQSLVGNYSDEYDSARNLAEERKEAATREAEIKGSELLNVVGGGGLSLLGRAVERAGLSGKISKGLDDVEGKFGPMGQRAFRIVRQVGSDIIGSHGKVGAVAKKLGVTKDTLKPQAQTDTPSNVVEEPTAAADTMAPENDVSPPTMSLQDEIVPALRGIGQNDLADRALTEHEANNGRLSNATSNEIYDQLSNANDETANQTAARMKEVVTQRRAMRGETQPDGTNAPPQEDEPQAQAQPPVEGESGQVAVQRTPGSFNPEPAPRTMTSYQSVPHTEGEDTDFGVGGRPIRPITQPDTEFGDTAGGVVGGLTTIVGLAGGNVDGVAGEGLRLGALGTQTAADLIQGNLPIGGIMAGIQTGLSQLGPEGQEAGQGLGMAATTAQVAMGARKVYGIAARAIKGPVQAGETEGTQVAAGDAPATATGTAVADGDLATTATTTAVAGATEGGEGGTATLATLGNLTEASAAGDVDPIGIAITAGLGLVTGLVGLGEGIRDIFEAHHTPHIPKPAMPSFQAGVQG